MGVLRRWGWSCSTTQSRGRSPGNTAPHREFQDHRPHPQSSRNFSDPYARRDETPGSCQSYDVPGSAGQNQ